MNAAEMIPVMNNTKWDELRLAMYSLADLHPKWRTRHIETGFTADWDEEWFYHFRNGGYESIEWVEIRTTSPDQEAVVRDALRKVHVPGVKTDEGFRVMGFAKPGQQVDYIK